MKTLLIIAAVLVSAYGGVLPTRVFQGPNHGAPASATVAGDQRGARTLKLENEADVGTGYRFSYETDNGISAHEAGVPKDFGGNPSVVVNVAQGAFQWTSPEGKLVSITYTADENGYHPVGDAIPQ